MKKLLCIFAALLCLFLASALAEVEPVDPIDLDGYVSVTDYGFASADADGNITKYGCLLEVPESFKAESQKPLFYVTFQNNSDTMQEIRLYIRGGRQYDCYWSKTAAILAGKSYTFYGKGHKDAKKYAGDWSVDVVGRTTVRFTLEAD